MIYIVCQICESINFDILLHLSPFPLPCPLLISPDLPLHCPSSHNRPTDRKKNNIQVHSAIFQYLQYWYNQYFQNFPVSAILEYTGHCQNMSIADTGRFWEILFILVLQILEDSGKYWLYQYCRY
jgi:hypothetical protein